MKHWNNCTVKEKLERWVQAERVLKGLPKHVRMKHWDMRHWGIQTDCGTVCCAAGHCGLDPWFRKHGLKLKPITIDSLIQRKFYDNGLHEEGVSKKPKTLKDLESYIDVNFGQGGFENGVTVYEFFGNGANNIFGRSDIRTVNVVIKEVQKYIKEMKTRLADIEKAKLQHIKEYRAYATNEIKASIASIQKDLKIELDALEESYKTELAESFI